MGINTPNVKHINPSTRSTIFASRKGLTKLSRHIFLPVLVPRARTVRFAIPSNTSITNAPIRIVHAYPTLPINPLTIIGKTTPPILDPVETIPYAAPRRRLNQPGIHPIAGWKMGATPIALQTPWERRSW
jgi:hypothetical protein